MQGSWQLSVVAILTSTLAVPAVAQISIEAPATVPAGSQMEVSWSGGSESKEFITIVESGAREGSYGQYNYGESGTWKVAAPEIAGAYEIRFLAAKSPYPTLASRALEVTAVSATVEVQASADAGTPFVVHWTGPNNPKDFITLVKTGAPEKSYGQYVYTHEGSPVTLKAPDEPGDYEIRYATGRKYLTLARAPIRVGGVAATVEAPRQVGAGSGFSVTWTGPDNPKDYITIVKAGAPEKSYGAYAYTSSGNPLTLSSPEEPGEYEIRYLTGSMYLTLASAPITVGAVTASLDAPEQVTAGESFDVKWIGPDNARDFIAVAPAGSPPRSWPSYDYTQNGNPATLIAPLEAGDYELRYQTGRQYFVLATRAIRVGPAERRPGALRVVAPNDSGSTAILPAGAAVEFILDASGSMLQRLDGKRRIDIAKDVLVDLVQTDLSTGTLFALRVFGHRESGSCRTDLESPLGPLNPEAAAALIRKIEAKNLAKTPLGHSLELVASDLASVSGQRIVVLITDGEETCDGNPAEAIEKLRAGGIDVRVNIVGFAIDDADLKQEFHLWAKLGGGAYFDTDGADQLGQSLTEALRIPFDVFTAGGAVVASGLVNGDPVELLAGEYRISTRESPPQEIARAVVTADETATLTLDGQ